MPVCGIETSSGAVPRVTVSQEGAFMNGLPAPALYGAKIATYRVLTRNPGSATARCLHGSAAAHHGDGLFHVGVEMPVIVEMRHFAP